ncbi:zinc dependent phospholipase C family protein, partial [Neisseria meningitidis]|uniref:zinc dependent phospholipase C family protein n=1 Tax=Neisseria meningitidis TaxID=487 RepID=UPI000FCBB174
MLFSQGLDSRLRGNDGGAVSVAPDKFLKLKISSFPQDSHKNRKPKTETYIPSFPRKWESRNEKQQEFIGNDRN